MNGSGVSISGQLRSLKWLLAAIYLPTLLVLTGIGALGEDWAAFLLRDTHSLAGLPFFAGALSNIGVLLWTVALAVCLFCGVVLRRTPGHDEASKFLLSAGALTTLLTVDDFFLLHEDLFRHYVPLPEALVFGIYGAAAVAFLVRYRRIILASEYLLLLLALLLLAMSVAVDLFQNVVSTEQYQVIGGYVLEDGFKFTGILTWMVYFIRLCDQLLARRL
ncbi:MAG: hypothetical protein FD165_2687 [Gammaproteobacteria bacterium]|nr:MAG: hypothetical protein FD165_2687 [Gammaproteobacteria bacterium]TND01762.1 MAG: hypothetical protein FD120_2526 [Gammaproteobacteria bacterium]